MIPETAQGLDAGRGGQETHHVPGGQDDVEVRLDAAGGQVQFRQVTYQEGRSGMILLSGGDQDGVDVHPHHVMSAFVEPARVPARSASTVRASP